MEKMRPTRKKVIIILKSEGNLAAKAWIKHNGNKNEALLAAGNSLRAREFYPLRHRQKVSKNVKS